VGRTRRGRRSCCTSTGGRSITSIFAWRRTACCGRGRCPGAPQTSTENRLAVEVSDHDLDHLTYVDEDKDIADTGWWEEHDRSDRRMIFTLHGRVDAVRYALIRTAKDWLLHRIKDQA